MSTPANPPRPNRVAGPNYLVAGRYRLRSKIGGGGMGAVWRAKDELLDREVAIKQIVSTARMNASEAQQVRDQVIREGRIAAKFSNPHAIEMHDITLEANEPWLVMEYLPSRSLAQVLTMVDTLAPLQVAQIGAQIADALAAAHAVGIVHRDVKPGNILVTDRGEDAGTVKISDFGISSLSTDSHHDENGLITGTPAFFAPEVARGAHPTFASDVFALGATLYTATEGQPPFGIDEDQLVLLHRVAEARIILPQRSGPITEVLLKMLEPDPARRPDMQHVSAALARIAAGPGGNLSYILSAPIVSTEGKAPIWIRGSAATHYGRVAGSFTTHPRPVSAPQTNPSTSTKPYLWISLTLALVVIMLLLLVLLI
ncbi:MAG: serine/threonine-protein kinase [Mycobacteriaceae bacterium]